MPYDFERSTTPPGIIDRLFNAIVVIAGFAVTIGGCGLVARTWL